MQIDPLHSLAKSKRWDELEAEWLKVIERPDAAPEALLPVIDEVVNGGRDELAATMAWAWLSLTQETRSAREALRLGRGLLLRLPDGEQLREEILNLYVQTHSDHPELANWIDHSGMKSGKSVRRALRYLDVGLRLGVGAYLLHRTEDEAARIVSVQLDDDEICLKTARRTRTLSIAEVIEEYDPADENDYVVLRQLSPERIGQLVADDPIKLVIGILRCRRNKIDRDELKLMLVPRHLPQQKWSDWWGRIRAGVKKSPNLRIEGRSPMFLIYDPVGRTLEQETAAAFSTATTPRQWLDVLEGYLRDLRHRKGQPDAAFLSRVRSSLRKEIDRFRRHGEQAEAFATALVIQRLAADGLSLDDDASGEAVNMLIASDHPVEVAASVPDARLWSLAITCVERAFPERWPSLFAGLILFAPAGLCDTLATRVEKAGAGGLLVPIAERAAAEPGRHTDAMMWLWKGPTVRTELPLPPPLEMFNTILALVGPARISEGKAAGQTVNAMRARIRAGLGASSYATYKKCLDGLDADMAEAVRRQLERAEGLGPSVQGEMLNLLDQRFPRRDVKVEVPRWDDESVLYFTRNGLRGREAELEELVNVKMRENAKAIGAAAAHGDLSENSEYKFALEERDLLRARVARINRELSMACLIEPGDVPTDHVGIGQRVTLRPTGGGEDVVIMILGVGDSDITQRVYSYQTPMAKQVLGKRPGEPVSLSFDGEDRKEYEVSRIESGIS